MKNLFADYKTPTMAECEMLGKEIGLPKRVVQVWFQNARAKEKKAKLALQKSTGQEVETSKSPEECVLCSFKYSHKYSVQDHIFTRKHIDAIKGVIESGKLLMQQRTGKKEVRVPENPSILPAPSPLEDENSKSALVQQLQMLHNRMGGSNSTSLSAEDQQNLLQMYGLATSTSAIVNKTSDESGPSCLKTQKNRPLSSSGVSTSAGCGKRMICSL